MIKSCMNKTFAAKYLFYLSAVLLFSCRAQKEIQKQQAVAKDCESLIELAHQSEFKFDWLSLKSNVEIESDGKTNGFKAFINIKKDSVIWISITPKALRIEGARVMLTKDSIFFMDKINKKYFTGTYDYIEKILQVEAEYQTFQQILLGNALEFEQDKIWCKTEEDKYYLSTIKKRKLRKAENKDKAKSDFVQALWLNAETYKIEKLKLLDLVKNQSLEATYSNFSDEGGQLITHQINITVESEKTANLGLEITKVTVNEPSNFSFRIPEKYEQITFQ